MTGFKSIKTQKPMARQNIRVFKRVTRKCLGEGKKTHFPKLPQNTEGEKGGGNTGKKKTNVHGVYS